ncbi:MAG TPA: BTAD domain-containing putative transcriptional regulator [Gemmatimonadaceae bacterium]|nr:BTAD domain-containing putative transcriptional regulator [Gemmatimonadaceae bacterium]
MLEFRVLGPLEVVRDGEPIALPGQSSQRALAAIVLRFGSWVSVDRLIDDLWGESPPAAARKAMQMHISRLRGTLGNGAIVTGPAGYRLAAAAEAVDAARFARLVERAREASEPSTARVCAMQALASWRGPPLEELSLEGPLAIEVQRLEELRLVALELRIEADLQLGRHREIVAELRRLTAEWPWRESLQAQLMLALYRSGRQAEALTAYREARAVLVEQFGIEPGDGLREVHRAVLAQDVVPATSVVCQGLPRPTTSLVGREPELEQLASLLAEARVVTLIGPGGVGKTRLAVEVARRLAGEFVGGAVFVELAPLTRAEDLASAIAAALTLHLEEAESPTATLRRFLAGRHVLLVLDNFEHLLAGAPLIAELISASPRLTVLVTSREPLRLAAERRFAVPPLELPEGDEDSAAVALFCERARARDPHFAMDPESAPHVREICRRLDGLPLALELAAAHAALLSPAELNARLRLALLAGGTTDVPERHRALRATIDSSYAPLDEEHRRAFRRMATFAGPVSVEAALVVADAGLPTLEALLDRQLLVRRDDRVGMLETIREYAAERLEDAGEAPAARACHAEFWMGVAEQAARGLDGAEWRSWQAQVRDAMNDFRAALAWTIAHDPAEVALRIATALRGFWDFSSQHDEAHQWLTEALAADRGRASAPVRAAALWARSTFADAAGAVSLEQAERDAAHALETYAERGDRAGMSRCRASLSIPHVYRGDYVSATALAAEAVELAESAGDEAALTWAYWCAVSAAVDFDSVQSPLAAALALAHQTGALWRVGRLLQAVAFIAMENERYADARMVHSEALESARLADDHECVADLQGNEAIAALLVGDSDAAACAAAEQLTVARRERVTWISCGLLTAATLAAQDNLVTEAATLCGAAEDLLRARSLVQAEHLLLRRVTQLRIDDLRAQQPMRWTLAAERAHTIGLEAVIDLALEVCGSAASERPPDVAG